jgi:hypothetical protein
LKEGANREAISSAAEIESKQIALHVDVEQQRNCNRKLEKLRDAVRY